MFEVKRREQLLALKNLAQLNDIHQQYKILDVMLKGLFKVCQEAWQLAAGQGFSWSTEEGFSKGDSVHRGSDPYVEGLEWDSGNGGRN